MNLFRRRILRFSIAALVSGLLLAGAWECGRRTGIETGMRDSFYGHILHANQALSALQSLKENRSEATRYSLEVGLKLSAAMLAPGDRLALMNDKTREDAIQTLIKIKQYRKSNPLEEEDDGSRKLIEKLLESVPDFPALGVGK